MTDFLKEDQSNKHFEVTVLETESPDVYWVALKPDDKEETDSFSEFEKELNKYMKGRETGYKPVNSKEYVLAFNEKRRTWVRGQVHCIMERISGIQLEIFQLDYGSKILVTRNQICLLDTQKFLKRPFNAIKLQLPGLQPIGLGFIVGEEDLQVDLRYCNHWIESSQNFIEKCLTNCTRSRIHVLKKISPNKIHGELFLTIDGIELNISEELIDKKFAVRSDVLSSEESPESSDIPSSSEISCRDYHSSKKKGYSAHTHTGSCRQEEAYIELNNRQGLSGEALIHSRRLTSQESMNPTDKLKERCSPVGRVSRSMLNCSSTAGKHSANMSSKTTSNNSSGAVEKPAVTHVGNIHPQSHSSPILTRKESQTMNEQPYDERIRSRGRGYPLLALLEDLKNDTSLCSDNKTKSTHYSSRNSASSSSREHQVPLGLIDASPNESLNSGQLRINSSLPSVPRGRGLALILQSTSRDRRMTLHDSFRMDKETQIPGEKASICQQEETMKNNNCPKTNSCSTTSRFKETQRVPNRNIDGCCIGNEMNLSPT